MGHQVSAYSASGSRIAEVYLGSGRYIQPAIYGYLDAESHNGGISGDGETEMVTPDRLRKAIRRASAAVSEAQPGVDRLRAVHDCLLFYLEDDANAKRRTLFSMIESLRAERIAFNNAARTRGEEPTFESFIAARRRSELLSPRAQAMAGQEQTSDHSSSKEQEREKQEDDDPSEETLALAHSDVRHLTQTARHAETPEDYKKWLADAMAVAGDGREWSVQRVRHALIGMRDNLRFSVAYLRLSEETLDFLKECMIGETISMKFY